MRVCLGADTFGWNVVYFLYGTKTHAFVGVGRVRRRLHNMRRECSQNFYRVYTVRKEVVSVDRFIERTL